MKRKYFIPLGLALLACPMLLWSQDYRGVIVKDGAAVTVFNGALVYSASGLEVESQGRVDNKGNIKVDGVYRNRAERDAKNVVLRYEAENKYGQLILKEGQNIDGRAVVEYPAANGGYVFGALPFSSVYDAKVDLAKDVYGDSSNFAYDGAKTVQALENSTLVKFNAINGRNIAQWEAVSQGESLDLTKAHIFKAGNRAFSLSGVPVSGPYTIAYQGLSNVDLNTAVTDYYDTNINGPQPVSEVIGGDFFEKNDSVEWGRRFFPFANPTTANVDLWKIAGFSDNVKGIAIPKKEVGRSDNSMARLKSYYISAFRDGVPTGDLDALYARPRDLVYVKMKQGKEQGLIINDDAKTFNQNSSYTKGSAAYDKLCLAFGGKRAYVFATDGATDGEFVEGEAYQPYKAGESTIYTLQNKVNIEASDYKTPLHTNVISRAWNKRIRLMVNGTSGNGTIDVLKQEGCTPGAFSIVKKGQPKGQALAEGQSIQVGQQGWSFYDIYYNNPIVRTRRSASHETERLKPEAFWCEGGQVCFNHVEEGKNVDIRVLSQDGSLRREDKVSASLSKPYKLPSDVDVYTVQYKFEGEKEFKALQAPSTDN